MNRITKMDDSKTNKEYFALDTNFWMEIDNHQIDGYKIVVGRPYGSKEVKVFIFVGDEENIKICNEYILFDRKNWVELRKSRGANKHKTMKINKEGTIYVGEKYNGCETKTFIERDSK